MEMSESNNQNGVLEAGLRKRNVRSLADIRTGGLEHISVLTEKVTRVLEQLPRQAEEEATCKMCDGTKAITRKIRGMVYECVCPCAANY